jgi:hypothetical protein
VRLLLPNKSRLASRYDDELIFNALSKRNLIGHRMQRTYAKKRDNANTLALRFPLIAEVAHVSPDPPTRQQYANDSNQEIEAMKPRLQGIVLVPFLAEFLPHVGEA